MSAPAKLVRHLQEHGYHSRSSKHGDALCELVLEDLLTSCPRIAEHAAEGRLVHDLRRKVIIGGSQWNIDLVLGPPPSVFTKNSPANAIQRHPPATIRIAIEVKTIMTEHGKARRNRQRDLDSFHQFVHRYDPDAIAGSVTIVNIAKRFKSPLRQEISTHRNIESLVHGTLALLRELPIRSSPNEGPGLEANGAIVVDYDNIIRKKARLVNSAPAPKIGDPLHYDSFLRRICDRYTQRWF